MLACLFFSCTLYLYREKADSIFSIYFPFLFPHNQNVWSIIYLSKRQDTTHFLPYAETRRIILWWLLEQTIQVSLKIDVFCFFFYILFWIYFRCYSKHSNNLYLDIPAAIFFSNVFGIYYSSEFSCCYYVRVASSKCFQCRFKRPNTSSTYISWTLPFFFPKCLRRRSMLPKYILRFLLSVVFSG